MSTTEASPAGGGTFQRIVVAIGLFLIMLGVVSFLVPRNKATPPDMQAPEAPIKPARNTTNLTVQELVARFNKFSSPVFGSRYLLPADMKPSIRNDAFHVYNIKIGIGQLSIEADNQSGRPFSLGLIAANSTTDETAEMVGLLAAMGATMLGKGQQAAALVQTCATAADSPSKSSEIQVGDFTVICSNVMGGWMAGISVTKDKLITSGKATVPMQPDAP